MRVFQANFYHPINRTVTLEVKPVNQQAIRPMAQALWAIVKNGLPVQGEGAYLGGRAGPRLHKNLCLLQMGCVD